MLHITIPYHACDIHNNDPLSLELHDTRFPKDLLVAKVEDMEEGESVGLEERR
jgi:hypothetical protein